MYHSVIFTPVYSADLLYVGNGYRLMELIINNKDLHSHFENILPQCFQLLLNNDGDFCLRLCQYDFKVVCCRIVVQILNVLTV